MKRLMSKTLASRSKFLLLLSAVGSLYSAAPSKHIEPAIFYSEDFEHKRGMKYVHIETKFGILGNEVYVGRPKVFVNDSIVLCACGKEAVNIYFKDGDVFATCYECGTKKEPVNQVKYGNTKKKPEELNKKK